MHSKTENRHSLEHVSGKAEVDLDNANNLPERFRMAVAGVTGRKRMQSMMSAKIVRMI